MAKPVLCSVVLLSAGLMMTSCVSPSPRTAIPKDQYQRVAAWLGQIDVEGSRLFRPPDPPVSYDNWIAQGRAIPQVRAILEQMLARRDRQVNLVTVAYALGLFGGSTSVPVLTDAMDARAYRYWMVRERAAASLGQLRDPAAMAVLCKVAAKDKSDSVRSAAAWALGEIGDERARPCLDAILRDTDKNVRHNAQIAIRKLDEKR